MLEVAVVPSQSQGISPKAILAAALPALGTVLAVILQWVVTGEYDRSELVTSVVGLIGALTSGLGAWLGAPGTVKVDPAQNPQIIAAQDPQAAHSPPDVGPANDDLIAEHIPDDLKEP